MNEQQQNQPMKPDSSDRQQVYHNISGYCFVSISEPEAVRDSLRASLLPLRVLGTILVANEGLNVALVGSEADIKQAQEHFTSSEMFASIDFKLSVSTFSPFSKLKIKVRPEIITFAQSDVNPITEKAASLSAQELKQWLDENRDFQLLDTRNTYEIDSGTFDTAMTLDIENFRDLPDAVEQAVACGKLDPDKPVVAFCTGGVRCEKAAPWMSNRGFKEVYQVDGGILRYFEQCGDAHWQGDCFVFDDRVEITPQLAETGAVICRRCHKAVSVRHQQAPDYLADQHCPACVGSDIGLRTNPHI